MLRNCNKFLYEISYKLIRHTTLIYSSSPLDFLFNPMFNFKIWAIFKLLDGNGLKFVALVIVTTVPTPSADSAVRTSAALCVRNMELLSQIAAHCTLLRSMSKQQNYYTFQNNAVFEQNFTTSLFLSTFSTTN